MAKALSGVGRQRRAKLLRSYVAGARIFSGGGLRQPTVRHRAGAGPRNGVEVCLDLNLNDDESTSIECWRNVGLLDPQRIDETVGGYLFPTH